MHNHISKQNDGKIALLYKFKILKLNRFEFQQKILCKERIYRERKSV